MGNISHSVLQFQIVHKINIELAHARSELAKTVKDGDSEEINRLACKKFWNLLKIFECFVICRARKRVGWLEDRMEHILGKKRQRVHSHGKFNIS